MKVLDNDREGCKRVHSEPMGGVSNDLNLLLRDRYIIKSLFTINSFIQ